MSHFHPSLFLRRSLILDAVASGATAALMLAGAGLLEGWLGLPAALMRGAGLVLVPYVAFVGYLATRETLTLAAVWSEVLGVERVGVRDNFFALGGDSLIAVRLVLEIESVFGIKLPAASLFPQGTIESLAATIDNRQTPQRRPALVPLRRVQSAIHQR